MRSRGFIKPIHLSVSLGVLCCFSIELIADKVEPSHPIFKKEKPDSVRKDPSSLDPVKTDFSIGSSGGESLDGASGAITAPEISSSSKKPQSGADDNWILNAPDAFSTDSVEAAFGVRSQEKKEEKPNGFLELYMAELKAQDEAELKKSTKTDPNSNSKEKKDGKADKESVTTIKNIQNNTEDITGSGILKSEKENLLLGSNDPSFDKMNRIGDSLGQVQDTLLSAEKMHEMREERLTKMKEFNAILDGPRTKVDTGMPDGTKNFLDRVGTPPPPVRVQTSSPLNFNNPLSSPMISSAGGLPSLRGSAIPVEPSPMQQNLSRAAIPEMIRPGAAMMQKPFESVSPRQGFSALDGPNPLGSRR